MILDRSREVFARRGYHAAKIDDIVAAAGVARGTFYQYFDDKRAVFDEIVDGAFASLERAIMRVEPGRADASVADQIKTNIRQIVGTLLDDRATTKILLSDAVGLDPELDRKLISFYGKVGTLLSESLADGQALGVVAPGDPVVLSIMVLGSLKELVYQVVMRDLPLPEAALVDSIYDFLRDGCLRVPH